MVGGIGPGVPYSPAVALAALTATLVTLILAFNAWWNSEGQQGPKRIESSSSDDTEEDVIDRDKSSSSEEGSSTKFEFVFCSSTELQQPHFDDYELDSLEDTVENEPLKTKAELEPNITFEEKDKIFLKSFEGEKRGASQNEVRSLNESTTKAASPLRASEDKELFDEVASSGKLEKDHSSISDFSDKISSDYEYQIPGEKTRSASLELEQLEHAGESEADQQCGTGLGDVGQTTFHFVQFQSELSSNFSSNGAQLVERVTSRFELDCGKDIDDSELHALDVNAKEAFNMKVADLAELGVGGDQNSIALLNYGEDPHNEVDENFSAMNVIIKVGVMEKDESCLQKTVDPTYTASGDTTRSDILDSPKTLKISEPANECSINQPTSRYDQEYENHEIMEKTCTIKNVDRILNDRHSIETFLSDKDTNSSELQFSNNSNSLLSCDSELFHEDNSNNVIVKENVDPDILYHLASQGENFIPDIVPLSSPKHNKMSTSDILYFLYDEKDETSKKVAMKIKQTDHNIPETNPVQIIVEDDMLTEVDSEKTTEIKEPYDSELVTKIIEEDKETSIVDNHEPEVRMTTNIFTFKIDLKNNENFHETSEIPGTFDLRVTAERHADSARLKFDSLHEPELIMEEKRQEEDISQLNSRVVEVGVEEVKDEGEIKNSFMKSTGETSKSNNGGINSCLPSPYDVTSVAMHHGPLVREEQGSGREKLIGKACAFQNYHSNIAASPAESEKRDASPPPMVVAAGDDSGVDMAASSCKEHDQGSNPDLLNLNRETAAQQFSSLDALVDHLRELAADSPPVGDESVDTETDRDADVSDNIISTTDEHSFTSTTTTTSGLIRDSHDLSPSVDLPKSLVFTHEDTVRSDDLLVSSSVYNASIESECRRESFGLLYEYYDDFNLSDTQDISVSDSLISQEFSSSREVPISTSFLDECSFEPLTSSREISKSLSDEDSLPQTVNSLNLDPEINQNNSSLSNSNEVTCLVSSALQSVKPRTAINSSANVKKQNIQHGDSVHNNVSTKTEIGDVTEKTSDFQKCSASELTSDETDNSDAMEDSTSNLRLLKLLERNKKRQERLRHLSKLTNECDGDNAGTQEQKNDTQHTLDALESAIGHIQQLINNDPNTNFRRKQLNLDAETIAASSRTEADTDASVSSKGHRNINSPHDLLKFVNISSHNKAFVQQETSENELNIQNILTNTSDIFEQNRERKWEEGMPNVFETPAREKWSSNSTAEKNENFSKVENTNVANVFSKRADRWRYSKKEGADDNIHEELLSKNYNSKQKFGNLSHQSERIQDAVISNKKSCIKNFDQNEIQLRYNIEREPRRGIKSMSQGIEGGRCQQRDVTYSPPLRFGAAEKTAVSAERSLSHVIERDEFLRSLRMQEQQQNGDDAEGAVEIDSPSKQNAATNTTTPTKIKNLRFKLDPDIYDLPSENGYEEDEYDYRYRRGWKRQPKYQTFSSLELGRNNQNNREPVKVVSVRTSVVPGGQKMVVKPVCVSEGQRSKPKADDATVTVKHLDIDLHIRLETSGSDQKGSEPTNDVVRGDWRASPEKNITKRQNTNSSPSSQYTKRRSPIPEYSGWNQSLSPVTENCDWTPGANGSAEDLVLLSTSSDPGQRHRWTPDSGHQSPASWDVEDPPFRFKEDFPKSETLDSIVGLNGGECDVQRSDESRHVTHSRSSDNLSSDNEGPKSEPVWSISSSNSTPARPSSLSLSHFRKHLNLPKKRFVPDPDAVERITGYKAAEQTSSSSRPPLPPSLSRPLPSYRLSSGAKNRIDQLRKKYLDSAKSQILAAQKADATAKFEQFLNQAQRDRTNLITSTPDLAAFEAAVRSQWSKISMANGQKPSEYDCDSSKENTPPPQSNEEGGEIQFRSRSNTPDHVWMSYVQLLRRQLNRRSQSLCYLETDVDALFGIEDLSQSMTTLERSSSPESSKSLASMPLPNSRKANRISLSLEESGRTKSEHELRVEKSLQNLTLPDWYKHSSRPKTGFLLEKKTQEKRGWAAAKSLASSTSSLTCSDSKHRRSARSLRASRENLPWSRGSASPASADNSYKGWSRSNSGPVLSLALAKAFREPYMGWRARTPSSCASPSPQVDFSPPSWVVMGDTTNTDRSDTPLTSDLQIMDEEGDTGVSFDGEDVLEEDSTSDKLNELKPRDSPLIEVPSADDTCDDVINISMDTYEEQAAPAFRNGYLDEANDLRNTGGEDTCDDIKNITLDTCDDQTCEKILSPQTGDDTCDDVLNISTDTASSQAAIPVINGDAEREVQHQLSYRDSISKSTSSIPPLSKSLVNGSEHHSGSDSPVVFRNREKDILNRSRFDPKRKRYSYNRSIYQNELDGLRRDPDQRTPLDVRSSTRSLPGKNPEADEEGDRDSNKVIWIESSFVGSRTTTSIMVLPTDVDGQRDGRKGGSTGSNSSVGRPASR